VELAILMTENQLIARSVTSNARNARLFRIYVNLVNVKEIDQAYIVCVQMAFLMMEFQSIVSHVRLNV